MTLFNCYLFVQWAASLKSLHVISSLTTFAEAIENECINDIYCQRTHATCISAKTDKPCSAAFLWELSYLLRLIRMYNDVVLRKNVHFGCPKNKILHFNLCFLQKPVFCGQFFFTGLENLDSKMP